MEQHMAQAQTFKKASTNGGSSLETSQTGSRSENTIDSLIRFSLLAWRTEIGAQTPRWSNVQDRIFSGSNELRSPNNHS
jgi:hypothetical protein